MLIIGQPKSASTALMMTLAKILNIGCREGLIKKTNDIECKGYEVLKECHRNLSERSIEYLRQIIEGKGKVFKEHLLPTKEHIDRLKEINKPVVVLLRKPEDSLDSYIRQFDKNGNHHTDRKGLEKDLKKFNKAWLKVDEEFILKVTYEDLILNYESTMKKILNWFGFDNYKIIPLLQIRYTGIGEERLKEKAYFEDIELKGVDLVTDSTTEERVDELIKDDSANTES